MPEVAKRVLVDTNVLIYDIFEDSAYHREASAILDGAEQWVIPTIVVHELIWFFRGLGLGLRDALPVITQRITHEKAVVRPVTLSEITRALRIIEAEHLALSRYNDKLILVVAQNERVPIATFDAKLRRQAKRLGLEVLPREL